MARKPYRGRTRTVGLDINKMSQEIRGILNELGMEVVGELAEAVAEEANLNAPVIQEDAPLLAGQELRRGPDKKGKSSSGPIKNSIFAQASNKVPLSWLVCSPAWYSHFYEYGTDPHDMPRKSKLGKKMVFSGTNEFFGERIETPIVRHPGFKGSPFLRPAADKAEEFAEKIIKEKGLSKT